MLDIYTLNPPPTNSKQLDKYSYPSGTTPCFACSKPIKDATAKYWVYVHGGGGLLVTDEEAEALNKIDNGASDCGCWPIGADCMKKYSPEITPYIRRAI